MMSFDLTELLESVFDPEPGEVVTVGCDVPRDDIPDSEAWQERRVMAQEWQQAFAGLGRSRGFETNPLLTYRATGAGGVELPETARIGGQDVSMGEVLERSTLVAFLTQYSATAPLDGYAKRLPDFRGASLPGVCKRMEKTALAADYREVARRCAAILEVLQATESVEVTFSTGHGCTFDLRFRTPEMDDGICPRDKQGERLINLPSGETYIVPYEGERSGTPSATAGTIPVRVGEELILFGIEANRIISVEGGGGEAQRFRDFFAADPARTNVAEVGFGCNPWAQVTGSVLEDEKAGFHWAYGRSEHLGGTVSPSNFAAPELVVHNDIVYARGNPIQVREAVALGPNGRTVLISDGEYVIF
jgi:hypothetical protein